MSGRIEETNYEDAKQRYLSDQCELTEFTNSDTTYIAVTSLSRGSIEKYVDEVMDELGMPQRALTLFLKKRAGYRGNSAVEFPHEKAYDEADLEDAYRKHIQHPHPSHSITELVERVVSGENITLVCYEEEGKSCHRHILVDEIKSQVESRENCEFTLRA